MKLPQDPSDCHTTTGHSMKSRGKPSKSYKSRVTAPRESDEIPGLVVDCRIYGRRAPSWEFVKKFHQYKIPENLPITTFPGLQSVSGLSWDPTGSHYDHTINQKSENFVRFSWWGHPGFQGFGDLPPTFHRMSGSRVTPWGILRQFHQYKTPKTIQ